MKKTYLIQLLASDRILFAVVLLFMLGQLFFTLKGVETFPFLNYGMYSETVPACDSQTVYKLTISGQHIPLTSLTDCERDITLNSIQLYDQLKRNNGQEKVEDVIDYRLKNNINKITLASIKSKLLNDSSAVARYPKWLMKYLADMRMVNSSTLQLSKSTLTYDNKGNITISSPVIIGEYAEQ